MSKRISQEEFENRIKQHFPTEEFEIIKYEGLEVFLKIKCCNCGNIIEVNKANNFLAPTKVYGCKNCHGYQRERENKINKIKEKYDIVKTEVKETHTYYTIRCKKCQHLRTSTLNNLYKHLECGCETGTIRNRTPEEFIKEVNKNSPCGTYELLSDYDGQTKKVKLRHDCGFIWDVRPGDAIHGKSMCPKCARKESKGERLIKKILTNYNYIFQQEKKLDNSRQRFDFYLEIRNKKIAIEYNGYQHYHETDFFDSDLKIFQERDNRKREYCKLHNIFLIEIPYSWSDKTVEKELINKLNDYLNRE